MLLIQSAGVDSQAVLYIASDVTKDLVTDENPEKYNHLPKTASLFTAVILIAIGKTFRSLCKLNLEVVSI